GRGAAYAARRGGARDAGWTGLPAGLTLTLFRTQLARRCPVLLLYFKDDPVDRARSGVQGAHGGLGDGLHKGALLLRRAALEQLNINGWHNRFSFQVR